MFPFMYKDFTISRTTALVFLCVFILVFVCVSVCANMRLTGFTTNSLVSGLGRILYLCCVKIYEDVCV